MSCEIQWNTLSLPVWREKFAQVRRAPLTQSYDYARAACAHYGQKARWGLITLNGQEAGLVQVMEAGLCRNLLHAVVMDGGPLWFPGFGTPAQVRDFFNMFNKTFPRRLGRRRRVMPYLPAGENTAQMMRDCGYIPRGTEDNATIWLDLTPDEAALRAALRPNWRGTLRAAEQKNITVDWSYPAAALLSGYAVHRQEKAYAGASPRLLARLYQAFSQQNKAFCAAALLDNRAVAAILVLGHGTSATYQAAWSLPEGRKAGTPALLLWQAILRLKTAGCRDFDLGGINQGAAQGVADFKGGLGGEIVTYSGCYG